MSQPGLFSSHWHRVKDLKPEIPGDVKVSRQVFRGISYHLMHRGTASGYHRLDSLAYDLVSRFDGTMTISDIWEAAQKSHGAEAPTQPDFIALLSTLHEADLVVIDRSLDADRLFKRSETDSRRVALQRVSNPLYLRFRIADPHQLLNWLQPRIVPLFTRTTLAVWLIGLFIALVQLLPHQNELLTEVAELDLLSPAHLGMFISIFVVMKLFHELAHAVTVRHFGGEVHELGIAFMVLLPNPYTDASASIFFSSKHHRMLVSAAGIMVELAFAGIGAVLWTISDGSLHTLALITLLTGSVSTVLFNGNPLLKFDGYYVLADWLEIPNLAERSRRYLMGKAKRLLLRLPDDAPTPADAGEQRWLIGYGITSTMYRILLMATIAWMLSGQYFLFGKLLAIYVLISLLLVPTWRLATYIKRLAPTARWRSASIITTLLVSLLSLVFLVPLPQTTIADGVVWLPEHAIVRVANDCEITEVLSIPGTTVFPDTPLLQCSDAELDNRLITIGTTVQELSAERAGLAIENPPYYKLLSQKIDTAMAELQQTEQLIEKQRLKSQTGGRFLIQGQQQLLGKYFAQGSIVGYVVPEKERTIRVALHQQEIKLVDRLVQPIEVFMLQHVGTSQGFNSHVVQQTPKPSRNVVSPALTTLGGGRLAATRNDQGILLDRPAFDVELNWPESAPETAVGGRVKVKFVHQATPLIHRLVDRVRDALIERVRA